MIAPAPRATAWLMQAAVADGFASPLQACSVMPAFPSAVWSALLPIAKTGTDREIGTYQTDLPLSDFTFFSAGPGAGKLVVGRLRLATTARARLTPTEEAPVVELAFLLELPHAASNAAPRTTANIATDRERLGFVRFQGISCSVILFRGSGQFSPHVGARFRSKVVRVTATTRAAP
jgi:hypothetical protein